MPTIRPVIVGAIIRSVISAPIISAIVTTSIGSTINPANVPPVRSIIVLCISV